MGNKWGDFNKKLLRGVQGGGFLEKSPPGRRRPSYFSHLNTWLNVFENFKEGKTDEI